MYIGSFWFEFLFMFNLILFTSCDADPAALAKYVIALAKKDKPEADLKALCEDQLDVFLGEGIVYLSEKQ